MRLFTPKAMLLFALSVFLGFANSLSAQSWEHEAWALYEDTSAQSNIKRCNLGNYVSVSALTNSENNLSNLYHSMVFGYAVIPNVGSGLVIYVIDQQKSYPNASQVQSKFWMGEPNSITSEIYSAVGDVTPQNPTTLAFSNFLTEKFFTEHILTSKPNRFFYVDIGGAPGAEYAFDFYDSEKAFKKFFECMAIVNTMVSQ